MLIPKSAATASDQALTICLAQPQHQPQYGLLPTAPNLVYFPPGTTCWRTPRFRFVFKKKKKILSFSYCKNPYPFSAAQRRLGTPQMVIEVLCYLAPHSSTHTFQHHPPSPCSHPVTHSPIQNLVAFTEHFLYIGGSKPEALCSPEAISK